MPVFSGAQPATPAEAEQAESALAVLSRPTTPKWLHGRLVTLLSHYFVASSDAKVIEAMADDWHALLSSYPAWAISNACRWWISRDNADRRRKPMPGDIEARTHVETMRLRVARATLDRGIAEAALPKPERQVDKTTAEERAQIAARVFADLGVNERFASHRSEPNVED